MQVICSILNDQTDVKFADDTYLVIPAASADTRVAELGHTAAWTADNNLWLNKSKTSPMSPVNLKCLASLGLYGIPILS